MKTVKVALNAFSTGQLSTALISKLTTLLSHYGCRSLPTPENVKTLILEVAHHEFMIKAAEATCGMHAGVPEEHKSFGPSIQSKNCMEYTIHSLEVQKE